MQSTRLFWACALVFATAVVAHEVDFDEDITAAIMGNLFAKPSIKDAPEQGLVQTGSSDFVADYPGCSLGYFWCMKLKDANVTSFHAARLTFAPIPNDTHHFEWLFDGKPTCVAQGPSYHACELDSVLHCAGGSDYGRAEAQAEALKLAMDNNGVHPECPSCASDRSMPYSISYCLVPKGSECQYLCAEGYSTTGPRLCQDNGTFAGGSCVATAVDTETHEMMTPSPHPVVSPSPSPSMIVITAQDVAHENWTMYEQTLEYEATAAYRKMVSESACLYLLDLENDFHSRGFEPRKPLRANLVPAARAAECAWVHEQVFSRSEEKKHVVPVRGDHGPWPRVLTPNIVHVRVTGGEVVALSLDLQNSSGKDLYNALARRLSISPDSFSIYFGVHPIDENQPLKPLGIKTSDTLTYAEGQQPRQAIEQGKQLAWKRGTVADGDRGVLAP